jgi:hypothetical protein
MVGIVRGSTLPFLLDLSRPVDYNFVRDKTYGGTGTGVSNWR